MPPIDDRDTLDEASARAVWALRCVERGSAGLWSAADAEEATREALHGLPAAASDASFLARRAGLALPRLQPRLPGLTEWLARPAWTTSAGAAVWVGAFVLGAAIDHIGGSRGVNLLAPPVWAVLLWNLAVYAWLLLEVWRPAEFDGGLRAAVSHWLRPRLASPTPATPAAAALLARIVADDARLTAPLTMARWARWVHGAAALLALGLVAGLYLRGLVLDYRAGWQSTFLDAAQVQVALTTLLAPAAMVTGIAVPDAAALRISPDQMAVGPAAPWLHLYAATLALFVVLPRALLAAAAARRCSRLKRHLLTPTDDPDLAALAATARAAPLRLGLWSDHPSDGERLSAQLASPASPGIVWRVLDEAQLAAARPSADASCRQRLAAAWWRWRDPALRQAVDDARAQWRELDLVILRGAAETPSAAVQAWLQSLPRPTVHLRDELLVAAEACWINDAALWRVLSEAIPRPRRAVVERLAAAAQAQHLARLRQAVQRLAEHHAELMALQLDVPADADAGERLRQATEPLMRRLSVDLHALHGLDDALPPSPALVASEAGAVQLRKHVPEAKAAVLGGALTGALTGLKADLASGGLTMGGGLLAGGLLGALGAAGVARGANRVRGTRHDRARWDIPALQRLLHAALMQYLLVAHRGRSDLDPTRWSAALDRTLAADTLPWQLLWTAAQEGHPPAATALQEPIEQLLWRALRDLHPDGDVVPPQER